MQRGKWEFNETPHQTLGVVKRSLGFNQQFAFTAELTVATDKGLVTVREGGHTAEGAAERARFAARSAEMFAGTKRATGFNRESVLTDDLTKRRKAKAGIATELRRAA